MWCVVPHGGVGRAAGALVDAAIEPAQVRLHRRRGDFPVHPDRAGGARGVGVIADRGAERDEGVGQTVALVLLLRPEGGA